MPSVVNSIAPAQGPVSGGTTVVITGTGLTGATAVRFGSLNAASYSVSSATQITAVTPAGSAGSVPVTVTSPSGTSNATVTFTYTAVVPPVVTGLTPSGGPTSGGTTVTVTGTGLTGATQVRFGSVSASSFSVVSATQITAVSPAGAPGAVPVTVTTPGGTSAAVPASYFFYAAAPVLTAISPSAGPTTGGNTVTLTGQNLQDAGDVRFGALSAAVDAVSPTQLTVTPPAGSGLVTVTVTTPGGVSNALTYAYVTAPVLNTVSPSVGAAAGSTAVTLTGTGLTTATAVTVDGVPTSFTVLSDTQMAAVIPPGPAGAAAVRVTTAGGTSGAVNFQRIPAPVI
ncbi:IPT/TIG domain-containing protein [Streptomyces murinus]|uniref:IPT/TIG domain-containing protein n=1 Tax=Streptomyces murinus TaxID=33900 RepID=UPI000A1EB696|nr:IPT/TIG domain-containing protein [Streptomyces murinus]WDO07643.1 IPT/TIG domain-containing protein [Streptomyces murinus]